MSEEHWGYVILAYGATGATVLFLALRVWLEHRRLTAELARLEHGGHEESEAR